MTDLEFFWDPVCPWSWVAAEWVREVQRQRALHVAWRPLSLRLLNEGTIDYATDELHDRVHTAGLRLLRVANILRRCGESNRLGEYYEIVGRRIHVEGRGQVFEEVAGIADVLGHMGLSGDLAVAATDIRGDEDLRSEVRLARGRLGDGFGVPVLTFSPPDGPSFFGPVISQIPRGPRAAALWDLVSELARWPGFAELKRSTRNEPAVA